MPFTLPRDSFKIKDTMTSFMKPDQKQNGHNTEEYFVYKENCMKYFKTPDDHIKFTVIGNRVTKEFIYCMCLLTNLHKYRQKQFKVPVIRGVTSVEWPNVWNDLKIKFGTLAHCLKSEVAVLMDDKLLGGENELKEFVETRYVYHLRLDYYKEGIQQFANYVNSQGRPCAYLHISINGNPLGTLIFMLYADIVPLTCQNFLRMCKATKGGYAGTPIHRIVKNCWIQCGGFDLKSNKDLKCENFIIPHDRRGVLCMANNGRHNDCSTQFFVLLQPAPWMDHKYVAFGQLIEGERTLRKIENVPTCCESPKAEIIIYKAGIFDINSTMPINKHTKDYINGHIEDLNTIGEIFYEAILKKLFNELDKKMVKSKIKEDHQSTLEDIVKNVRRAKSFMLKNEHRIKPLVKVDSTGSRMSESDETIDDNDSDLQECEFEEYSHYKQVAPVATRRTDVEPKKQFYIPLADVRYPGEVHSNFDLQKLLRGDYCLQNDLQKDPVQKKEQFHIPDEVLYALFESYEKSDDEWEYFLGLDDEEEIKKYIKENVDTVSFAGPLVKKIANLNKKREIFDDLKEETTKTGAITDEELRLIRMAKNYNTAADKKKKIHSHSSLQSCMRDSETKSNLLRRISNLVHFDEEANDSDYGIDVFRDSASPSNDSTKTHVRDEELYELPSKMSFMSLYTKTSIASERQFLINKRKKQPSMTVVKYQIKNQFRETDLKNEESINADNVKG